MDNYQPTAERRACGVLHAAMCNVAKVPTSFPQGDITENGGNVNIAYNAKQANEQSFTWFVRYWLRLLNQLGIKASYDDSAKTLVIPGSRTDLERVILQQQQKSQDIQKQEVEAVAKLAQAIQQKDSKTDDAALAALVQWQILHPDEKNPRTSLSSAEMETLRSKFPQEHPVEYTDEQLLQRWKEIHREDVDKKSLTTEEKTLFVDYLRDEGSRKKEQETTDRKHAELLLWKDVHPEDVRRTTFLTDEESRGLHQYLVELEESNKKKSNPI